MSRNGDKQAYPVLGAAEWISLAAAPTFAIMAVLTGTLGGGPPDTFCSAAHRASPLSGMVLMYLLMSAFHSASWLKLISRRRSGARRSSRADGIFPPLSAEWIVTMAVENRPIDVDSCRDQKLAFELGPYGININAIAPSRTLTERIRPRWDQSSPEDQQAEIGRTPLRRIAEAADQAKVICFLASSDADFVTGVTIDVTGGN